MNHSTKLADLLQSTSGLHRARVTCLATSSSLCSRACPVLDTGSCRHRLALSTPATLLGSTKKCGCDLKSHFVRDSCQGIPASV